MSFCCNARRASASSVKCSVTRKVGAAEMRREILREVAVLSRSTIPTGMFSICPFPKMVAMKNRQSKGSTTQTPRYRRREVMRCHSRRITMRSAFIAQPNSLSFIFHSSFLKVRTSPVSIPLPAVWDVRVSRTSACHSCPSVWWISRWRSCPAD